MKSNPLNSKLAQWMVKRARGTIQGLRKRGGALAREQSIATPPGIEYHPDVDKPPVAGEITIAVTDFGEEAVAHREYDTVDAFLEADGEEQPSGHRWVDVAGLHPYVINRLKDHYGFHTLAAEDAFNIPQRPKVESYDGHLFIVARAIIPDSDQVVIEQVSFLYFPDSRLLLTFRETRKDTIWKRVRQRIDKPGSRLRAMGSPYLLYALLDGLTDMVFPALEHEEDLLDSLEESCLDRPTAKTQEVIHSLRKEMLQVRRSLVPMKDMLQTLHLDESDHLPDTVTDFVRDVLDHALQAIEMLDANRARANDLHDFYITIQAHHMNEVMKVLTIMASFFIPITFLAGVYGMNFEYIPELGFQYSYPIFWMVCISMVSGLFLFFRRKGWF